MINKIRKSKITKAGSLLLILLILQPYYSGLSAYANAGGPTQPEFSKYTAVGNSDFVDPFTGNVGYTIPLFEMGGYPVNLSYSGDISPQADAGWVGLGWSLNLGSINRGLRGVPDDFDGDEINVKNNNRPNINATVVFNNIKSETVGMQQQRGNSQIGKGKIKMASYKLSLSWDNNTGIGVGYGATWEKRTDVFKTSDPYDFCKSADSNVAKKAKEFAAKGLITVTGADTSFMGIKYSPQMGVDYDSKSRTNITASFINTTGKLSLLKNIHMNFNSRSSQYDLGCLTGFPISQSSNFAYSPDFSRHNAIQITPPETRTRTYTLALDFTKGKPIRQKRKLSALMTVTEEHIVKKEEMKKAVGYFHLRSIKYEKGTILDCEELPNSLGKQMEKYSRQLSPATKTYDVFNISAAGLSGSFRAHHNSVFMLAPADGGTKPYVNNISLKGEFGTTEIGVDIGIGINKESYGAIPDGHNEIVKNLKFKDEAVNSDYEHTTFRNDYEFIESDNNYFNGFAGTTTVRPQIVNRLGRFGSALIDKEKNQALQLNGQISKANRDARQQMITCNTAMVTSKTSFFKQIENYQRDLYGNPVIVGGMLSKTTIQRNSNYRKDHHISEIQVCQPDGTRYFFSTPIYNTQSTDVSFDASSLNKSNFNYVNGTCQYANTDLKKTDKGNKAKFFKSRTIAPYASTYLLNAIISPDYVDTDDNGPSENDIGNYVKFNYSLHQQSANLSISSSKVFKWRNPVEQGTANLNIGFKSDELDDKGYYSYGEKELWYAHSIETKDQIALFFLKPRNDGWGVIDEFGGINNTDGATQQYLHQIILYSKNDFKINGISSKPLKVINLDYSYDLCRNYSSFKYYNNTTPSLLGNEHPLYPTQLEGRYAGKLTLHKVWFTYGELGVPTAAPYILEYNTNNEYYAARSFDRWGTYMRDNYYQSGGTTIPTSDFPFTPQDDKTTVDQWSATWMLSDITLPSGGKIHFDYESDDYAFVQDKTAQRMIKIEGMNNAGKMSDKSDALFDHQNRKNKNYYLLFKKPGGSLVPASNYFRNGDLVYYSFNVKISPRSKNDNAYENVSGFFEIEDIGDASDNNLYGYIKVKRERAGMFNAHPVTRMALQYGMTNVPHNLHPGSDMRRADDKFKVRAIADMLFGVIPDMVSMIMGKYNYFEQFGFCQKLNLDKSYIRLPEIDGVKLGGGHRVKRVTLNDNWATMTNNGESSSSYAIEYDYTTKDQSGNAISSGVASYEPEVGCDENPWKEPLNAEAIKKMRNKRLKPLISYDLGPVGEEFFGAPSIGYSKVTIRNVYPNVNIIRHKTGYTVKEFYTAKDFPSIAERTPIQLKKVKFGTPDLSGSFKSKAAKERDKETEESDAKDKPTKFGKLSLDISASFSFVTATQGISVETNDMHGKPKAEWAYAEGNLEPLSGQEFFYKKRDINKLSNNITVLRPSQAIEETTAGLGIEPTIYGSQHTTSIHNIRPNINIDRFGTAIMFNILPGYSLHKEQSRLITFTKHITRRGILDSVVVHDKGSSTSTKNLAWDALTGQVLLSSVNNEYNDAVYSLVKPAHWMYKGMAGAYQNQNLKVEMNVISGIATDPTSKLLPGDELYLDDLSNEETYYVLDRQNTNVSIINKYGNSYSSGGVKTFVVKRSGHRNILGQTAETINLLKNPLNFVSHTFSVDKDWVVDAKAFVYDEVRRVLSKDNFCFRAGCSSTYENDSLPDTTSYGYSVVYNQGLIVPPLGPEDNSHYGRPSFENCCNQGIGIMGMMSPGGEGNNYPCMNICSSDGYALNEIVNPYTLGIRGVWRINGEYIYFEKRNNEAQRKQDLTNTNDANTTTMRFDGRLVDYKEFWTYNSSVWVSNLAQNIYNPWTFKETITQSDNSGNPIQSDNALEATGTQLFGYKRMLPIASTSNAIHRNILFDGFEDIDVNSFISWKCDSLTGNIIEPPLMGVTWGQDFCEQYRHWPVAKALLGGNNRISDKISHTGWKSLQMDRGITEIPLAALFGNISNPNTGIPLLNYRLGNPDFVDHFYPESNKDYLISFWVKETYRNQFKLVLKDGSGAIINLLQEGSKANVDGWKKITYKFGLGNSQSLGKIVFTNKAPKNNKLRYCYIDDIRVCPIQSTMKCFVYDYTNNRMMATLDDNNFATYFEYDEEGDLVRHKIETEKGIMTADENRKNTKR